MFQRDNAEIVFDDIIGDTALLSETSAIANNNKK